MRKVEKRHLDYVGYADPNDRDELTLEVLGLELAVKQAEQRIALLKQSLHIAEMSAKAKPPEEENKED